MSELTPREIVESLDRYIVGQADAKRAVAIAIRNRWRRQQLPEDIRADVTPKNIIMIGPTGVGKTEIARRLASLIQAPFVKVEATKYTEVGYHGRDVESMVRDLVEAASGSSARKSAARSSRMPRRKPERSFSIFSYRTHKTLMTTRRWPKDPSFPLAASLPAKNERSRPSGTGGFGKGWPRNSTRANSKIAW